MRILFLLLSTVAIADTGVWIDGEELCHFDWEVSQADLLSSDPLALEPCGVWDYSQWHPDTSTCDYWCGTTHHLETM